MKFSEIDRGSGHLIEGYGPDGILVAGRRYHAGLALTAERIIAPWGPANPADLAPEHLATLLDLTPQVILLGTGARQVFPAPAIYAALRERRLGLEVMDTGAACRTYNILLAEGRRVVAGLLPC